MTLKQECKYCLNKTIALRIQGFYIGSDKKVKLWECRSCGGIWK
jgi:hypothetical protein